MARACIVCGRNIKPDERAFLVDVGWKCDYCQFKFDEAMTERDKRRGLGRKEKARIRLKAAIYNPTKNEGTSNSATANC